MSIKFTWKHFVSIVLAIWNSFKTKKYSRKYAKISKQYPLKTCRTCAFLRIDSQSTFCEIENTGYTEDYRLYCSDSNPVCTYYRSINLKEETL